MTATASPPTEQNLPQSSGQDVPRHLLLAELLLWSVTLSVVFGFSRLFAGWGFFWPLATIALATHAGCALARRRGIGVGLTAVITAIGWVLLSTWLWFGETTTLLLPTQGTVDAFRAEVSNSWQAFNQLAAPVPARTGFLLAAALALYFAAFLADWAAFRLWSPIEAIVPASTLFVFAALLGSEQQRVTSGALFAAALVLYLLAHRVVRIEMQTAWLSSDLGTGGRWLLRTGAALAAVAILGGVLLGPRLPGANDAPLIDWRGEQAGPSSRVTISPLVDIKQRLVDQTNQELFTVSSDEPAYWRLTALDEFDGRIWKSGGRYTQADGSLPASVPAGVATRPVVQNYTIEALAALWLPAAYQPVAISTDAGARYQAESSTLIVDTKYANSDQVDYQVTSDIAQFTPAELDAANSPVPDELRHYLDLPDGFSRLAETTATSVRDRAGASTPYQLALALQDFFQGDGPFASDKRFVYDVSPSVTGHDENAIDQFLTERRGYCEQYAGTYAAMARYLGLPARVAVGFTWGDQDPADPNLYHVSGRYAHAWPEVWLGQSVGWVAFEPTPGRGAPGMDSYAGVTAQQDGSSTAPSTSTSTSTSTTTTPSASAEQNQPDTSSLEALDQRAAGSNAGGSSAWTSALHAISSRPVVVGLAVLLIAAAYVLGATSVRWRRRRARRAGAGDPSARVRVAWAELVEDLELLKVARRPSETNHELAERAAVALPALGGRLIELAGTVDAATFAPQLVSDADVADAFELAAEVSQLVHERVRRGDRWRHALDPRTLVATGPQHPQRSTVGAGPRA